MTKHSTLLGIYHSLASGRSVVKKLNRSGLRKVTLIHKDTNGKIHIENETISPIWIGALVGIAGIILGVLLDLIYIVKLNPLISFFLGGVLLFIGLYLFLRIRSGLGQEQIQRFARTITPDETFVVAQSPNIDAIRAMETMRHLEIGQAVTFLIRPNRLNLEDKYALLPHTPVPVDQIEEMGKQTARKILHDPLRHTRNTYLLQRLETSKEILTEIHQELADAERMEQSVTLSVEWWLDNFYLVRGHIADIKRNLPKSYYRELPKITDGNNKNIPRIYIIAMELIAATDGKLSQDNIIRFIKAFQEISPLNIGELWAMPLLLRLALIECLRNLVLRIDYRQREGELAIFWGNRLLNFIHRDPEQLKRILKDLEQEKPAISPHFAQELLDHLFDEDRLLIPVREWLEKRLGTNLMETLHEDQIRESAEQESLANSITSLMVLSQIDWRLIFKEISKVDAILGQDPLKVFDKLDFRTLDLYRRNVERIAKSCPENEIQVAKNALGLSQEAKNPLQQHVGYYLIDQGRPELEKLVHYKPTLFERVQRGILKHPLLTYLGSIVLLTGLFEYGIIKYALHSLSVEADLALAFLALIPLSEVAVQLVNLIFTQILPPYSLPKMNYRDGIPQECKTLVVIPTLLTEEGIKDDLNRIEIHYLANPDAQLKFSIFSDYTDNKEETHKTDQILLGKMIKGIQNLNEKYGSGKFFLFHRSRLWSQSEKKFIGWERKRGKLEELNQFLLGKRSSNDPNILYAGQAENLKGIKYVITLDADTQLPKERAVRLVETLSHPLNVAYFDEKTGKVTRGYSIIQPRVSTSLPSANSTFFSRIFSGAVGADPYTQAVSDIYQDLVHEGNYHGKGIYDLEMFSKILDKRFPEAHLLSHDLLEGAYVRVGFAGGIELFDEFPENYVAWAKREHRWIRGDWQILNWIFPHVPGFSGKKEKNLISGMNRWKVFDNLRRSLIPIFLLLLVIGACLMASNPLVWLSIAALVLFIPTFTLFLFRTISPKQEIVLPSSQIENNFLKALVFAALLPHQAYNALDAIIRALYRKYISKHYLLQWTNRRNNGQQDYSLKFLWIPLFALVVGITILYVDYTAFWGAIPFLILWLCAPSLASYLSRPIDAIRGDKITEEEMGLLRQVARRTWRFFDDFIGTETNHLPPDNYQETHNEELAYRTSPTNIGLWLLSIYSSHDFGYITCDQAIEKSSDTVNTLLRMERYEGHLYNWYDIKTLLPLQPKYVSTVDSGNFLADLWMLQQTIPELYDEEIIKPAAFVGLQDTCHCLLQALHGNHELNEEVKKLHSKMHQENLPLAKIIALIRELSQKSEEILPKVPADNVEGLYWAKKLQSELSAYSSLIKRYFSWVDLMQQLDSEGLKQIHEQAYAWMEIALLEKISLSCLAKGHVEGIQNLLQLRDNIAAYTDTQVKWLDNLAEAFSKAQWFAGEKIAQGNSVLAGIDKISNEINMKFLYNSERKVFSIGFNVNDQRLDNSFYDLLASEARLSSFVAIARNDAHVDHWWSLGRPYAKAEGYTVLLSWGGTMFEYLMPLILTKSYEKSLLDNACKAAVTCQMAYAERRGIPWGISESAYCGVDARKTYQYRSFGVPKLGLKRGLEDDLVVSPYSSGLSLLVDPLKAVKNLKILMNQMHKEVFGRYGYYEAIDYTRQHGPHGERGVVIHAYMAHHQGMIFTSINNCLHNNILQNRFHSDPRVAAVESLLYERLPTSMPITRDYTRKLPVTRLMPLMPIVGMGKIDNPNTVTPKVNLISNGVYHVMITNSGSGYSHFNDIEINRWRADTTCDNWGSFIYIKDLESKQVWSAGYHPTGVKPDTFTVNFTSDKSEFIRRDKEIETKMEIVVSPEDNVEIRRITLANLSKRRRHIEVTSYSELSLASHSADRAHPVYNKMFIQTEVCPNPFGLIAFRRRKSDEDPYYFAGHVISSSDTAETALQFETDRRKFIGRGRDLANPEALDRDLTNTEGCVLDPIFSLRRQIVLEPGQRLEFSFVTVISDNKDNTLSLMQKYKDIRASNRAFEMSWTHSQLQLRHLRVQPEEAQFFQKLAGRLLYPQQQLRPTAERIKKNKLGQSRLWPYGISGDLPIISVMIGDPHDLDLVKQILIAHSFLNLRGLKCDLVFLNEEITAYDQPLKDQLSRSIDAHSYMIPVESNGKVYLLSIDQTPEEDLNLILSVSRAVLVAARGLLRQQLVPHLQTPKPPPLLQLSKTMSDSPSPPLPFMELNYFNGLGGYTKDGREYVIYLGPGTVTPSPWINVIANSQFGIMVSEAGLGSSWYGNSQTNRLTPWSNDPVLDPITDAIYIRDNELNVFWTPTPCPVREKDAYRIRHGQGYSHFEHNSHGIEQNLTVFVPIEEGTAPPLRIQKLTLKNVSGKKRKLSLYGYAQIVLGENHEDSQNYVFSSWDPESQAIFLCNNYNTYYGNNVTFATCTPFPKTYTADRAEFIGRNSSASKPEALKRIHLANKTGTSIDPCAGLHVDIELEPNQSMDLIFLLGQTPHAEEARKLMETYRDPARVNQALQATKDWWANHLSQLQIETPDLATNYLVNNWLLYQNLSSRIWGRTAFYQSSGAYGFRDQLQDVMATVYTVPETSREQILRAASHQFLEGDVQHWWHPISNAGIRTRISDDLLWLPFVTAQYVRVTGDLSILDVEVPFLEGPLLEENQVENYFIPTISSTTGTLLEHCRRAINKGLTHGPHNIPLIGSGDWNDGLNRVGYKGKGESIWLGWFVIHALKDYVELLTLTGKSDAAAAGYLSQANQIAEAIETHAWDGSWYLRAFFDDGAPLGSNNSIECKIDAIAQAWAVISGAGKKEHCEQALESVKKHLLNEKARFLQLLTPPFEKTSHDPGYIKGYPPGIRENGAQYTHGSQWAAMAFSRMDKGDEAINILQVMNPILRVPNEEAVKNYRTEPYVLAADIYSNPAYLGMGGWTWYTGSAGWMYRIWIEEVFGFKLRGNKLTIRPSKQTVWKNVQIRYRFGKTVYKFNLTKFDGSALEIDLVDDGQEHTHTL